MKQVHEKKKSKSNRLRFYRLFLLLFLLLAYLAQIRITLPESGVLFTKTPSNCKLDVDAPNANIMECDLNNGSPLFKGDKTGIQIGIDTTKLDGTELVIRANVFSTGDELNELDNVVDDIIPLKEFSDIEIIGYVALFDFAVFSIYQICVCFC